MEGSGVFATYKLQTNYRSNQEILDFANIALANIEANQYANLRLRANSLAKVTSSSFAEKVHLHYTNLPKMKNIEEQIPVVLKYEIKDYLDKCLARNEQVAFLAFTRRHVRIMQDVIEECYPNAKCVSLVPEKMFNGTIFSEFIKRYWDEVPFMPPKSIMQDIAKSVFARLPYIVYDAKRSEPHVKQLMTRWFQEEKYHIDAWQAQYMNGTLSKNKFLGNVKDNMIRFEIQNNAIKQSLLTARNEELRKTQATKDANFLFSTIHSAKGLEFDNVVTIYQGTNDMSEEKKRMYYVAFTRAIQSEYILAFDTIKSTKIVADYNFILDNLKAKEAASQTQPVASSTPPTEEKEDED